MAWWLLSDLVAQVDVVQDLTVEPYSKHLHAGIFEASKKGRLLGLIESSRIVQVRTREGVCCRGVGCKAGKDAESVKKPHGDSLPVTKLLC